MPAPTVIMDVINDVKEIQRYLAAVAPPGR